MFFDIAITLLSLIAIFERKRWAIIAATICLIFYIFFVLIFIVAMPNNINSNLIAGFSGPGVALPDEVFNDSGSFRGMLDAITIVFFEIVCFITGWVRVLSAPKNKELPPQQEDSFPVE